ncbi:MAG: hypothetical protein ACRDG7_09440 [Candidatus Limnocylindria bacterium]
MPHAIFGSPQVGSVGLLEREARERGVRHVVASYEYDQTAWGSSIEDHDGFVKVLADPDTGEILGCHILGADASTLIQGVANLVRSRLGERHASRDLRPSRASRGGASGVCAASSGDRRPARSRGGPDLSVVGRSSMMVIVPAARSPARRQSGELRCYGNALGALRSVAGSVDN